jgi:hypothetical protein
VLFTTYYYYDQVKKSEVGGTCSTHEGDEKSVQNCGGRLEEKKIHVRPWHR